MQVNYTKCFLYLLLFGSFSACRSHAQILHPLYDLDHPKRISLPPELDEISGISFDPADSGLYAVGDEAGIVYKIYPDKVGPLKSWNLAHDGDYEEITLTQDLLWLLRSDGKIEAFRPPLTEGMSPEVVAKTGEKGNEFEALLPDENSGRLTLICKNCEDDKKGRVGSYLYDIRENRFSAADFLVINAREFESAGFEKMRIHVTAAVWDPIRNRILLLASKPALLLELSPDHKLIQIYRLDPSVYNQPEGLTISGNGTLFITTERGEKGQAVLFVLPVTNHAAHR